jgi:glycosyltransferase involved in cell wall biosynthesis
MADMGSQEPESKPKVIVVMPAYNAAKTLRITYEAIPKDDIDHVILVDDGSEDETLKIARELKLEVFVHARNFGYGGNQKTCYTEALKAGADIVVMLHPDYQYDPTLLPEFVAPIGADEADVVLGSRFMSGSVVKQGMPWWKFLGNRALTRLQNWVLGQNLAEYHTGYRAFGRKVLEEVSFLSIPTSLFLTRRCSCKRFTWVSASRKLPYLHGIFLTHRAPVSSPASSTG